MDLENSRSSSSSSISRIWQGGKNFLSAFATSESAIREKCLCAYLLESVRVDVALEIGKAGRSGGAIFGLQV